MTRDMWIVFLTVLAIALLLMLFQLSFGFFNLPTQFFRAGAEQHSSQFFYLRPQMLYFALFVLYFFFCAGQRRKQERLSICNNTELALFPANRVKVIRTGGRAWMRKLPRRLTGYSLMVARYGNFSVKLNAACCRNARVLTASALTVSEARV